MKRSRPILPLSLRMIQGAIGKQFVIKHYRYGVVKTKFPDMSAITVSAGQRNCRDIFAAASKMASAIYKDPDRRKTFATAHRSPRAIYNAIVQYCRHELLSARERQEQGAVMIRKTFYGQVPGKHKAGIFPGITNLKMATSTKPLLEISTTLRKSYCRRAAAENASRLVIPYY